MRWNSIVWKVNLVFITVLVTVIGVSGFVSNVIYERDAVAAARDMSHSHLETILQGLDRLMMERENEGIGGRRSYFRENGYAAHVAWIPIYLSRFPDGPAAVNVRRLHETLRAVRPGPFHGINIGGPTECLWGRVN